MQKLFWSATKIGHTSADMCPFEMIPKPMESQDRDLSIALRIIVGQHHKSLQKTIISTDCPYGPKDVLENGKYGLLVPINNSIELSNAITYALNKKDLFNKKNLLKYVNKFDINKKIVDFIKILNINN